MTTTNNNTSSSLPVIVVVTDPNFLKDQNLSKNFPYWQTLEDYIKNPDPNIVKYRRGSELLELLEEAGALTLNNQGRLALKEFFTSHVQTTKNKVSRLLGFIAEALIVSSCRKNVNANRKWAMYARRGKRITGTPDSYIAIGTGLNSTQKHIIHNKLYNPFEPERDILWVHKDNVEKELSLLKNASSNPNCPVGLQIKVGSVGYVVDSLRQHKYQVPVVFFDLNDDFSSARRRLLNPRKEDLFLGWDASTIDQDFIRGKDVDEELHEALIEHSVLLREVVESRMKLEDLVERIPEFTTALSIQFAEEMLPKSSQIIAVNYEDLYQEKGKELERDYVAEVLNRKQAISLGFAKEVSNLESQAISLYETLSTEAEKYTEDSKFEPVCFSFSYGELSVLYHSGELQICTKFTLDKSEESWEATVNLCDLRELSRLPKSGDINITFDSDSNSIVFSSGSTKINIPTVDYGNEFGLFYFNPDNAIYWQDEEYLSDNTKISRSPFWETLTACAQLAIKTGNFPVRLTENKYFLLVGSPSSDVRASGACLYDSEQRIRVTFHLWSYKEKKSFSIGNKGLINTHWMIPIAAIAALPMSKSNIVFLKTNETFVADALVTEHKNRIPFSGDVLIQGDNIDIRGKLGEKLAWRLWLWEREELYGGVEFHCIQLNESAIKKVLAQISKVQKGELILEIIDSKIISTFINSSNLKIPADVYSYVNSYDKRVKVTVDVQLIKTVWQQLLKCGTSFLGIIVYEETHFLNIRGYSTSVQYWLSTISKIECKDIDSAQTVIKPIKHLSRYDEEWGETAVVAEQVEIPYIETPPEPPAYKETLSQIMLIAPEVKKALNPRKYHSLDADTVARIEKFRKQLETVWGLAQEFIDLANLHYENSGTQLSEENPLKNADGNPISKEQLRQVTIDIYQLLNRIRSVELNEIKLESRIRIVDE
ncbi:MAG: hypothetical protein U7127_09025 [Phormidium sp.]